MGDVAGDISLFSCPTGGLYLVGGISVAIEPLITGSNIFIEHYLNKDNFAFLLKTFPVFLVKNGNIGMLGAAECARRLLLHEN
jgi:glucokinase